jgi:hypothetical protein
MRGDLRCNAWYPVGCLKVWLERRVKRGPDLEAGFAIQRQREGYDETRGKNDGEFGWRGQKAKKKVVSRHYARIVERIGLARILW